MSRTFVEGGACLSRVREATVHQGREEATIHWEMGGTVCWGRKEPIRWGREEPFVEGGRNHLSRERWPFIEGGRNHSSWEEAIVHWGSKELFIEGGRVRSLRREAPVHWGREPVKRWLFIEWWECYSLREGGGNHLLRYGRAWERRLTFVEGGRLWGTVLKRNLSCTWRFGEGAEGVAARGNSQTDKELGVG